MTPQMTQISTYQVAIVGGGNRTITTWAATGLPPVGQVTVPFPAPLGSLPVRVLLARIGNAQFPGGQVSFDSSQGATDPTSTLSGGKLGYDQTNVYLRIATGKECIITAEY